MRRTVGLLLVFAAFLASGVALLAAAGTLPTGVAGVDRSAASKAVVERFYAAVNDALHTGNPPDLDGVVAPEALRSRGQPSADIIETLDWLRTAFPGGQLVVGDLIADGDRLVAVVAIDGDWHDPVTGLPVHGPSITWRAVDRFRLKEGQIVAFDRWEQDRDAASAQPLFAAPLARLPASPAAVEVTRVTLPPGARLSGLIGPGPELLLLERGSLAVRLAGSAQRGDPRGTGTPSEGGVTLSPGGLLVVPTGTPFAIENGGQVPAVVLEVALRPTAERTPENEGVDASALGSAAPVPGVAVQTLVSGQAVELPAGPGTVVATRLTLATGAGIAPHKVAGAELLAVEAGTLDLVISAGEGQLTRATGEERLTAPNASASGSGGPGRDGTLAAGEGALLPAGTGYAGRNAGTGPVELLVVRVVPAEPDSR